MHKSNNMFTEFLFGCNKITRTIDDLSRPETLNIKLFKHTFVTVYCQKKCRRLNAKMIKSEKNIEKMTLLQKIEKYQSFLNCIGVQMAVL